MKAVLKANEESNHMVKHNVDYTYKYDEQDNFFILIENSGWIEECSTAFDFN